MDSFTFFGTNIIHHQLNVPVDDHCLLDHKQSRNQGKAGRHGKYLFGQSDESEYLPAPSFSSQSIRFLGKGPDAIVRPGAVLLAPAEQQDHFLRQAAVFVMDMGESDTGDYLIRAVVIDNPTPFTIGEMMPTKRSGGIYDNLIFRGGDTGSKDEAEGCFCIHSFPELGREEIGTTGIYQGGELGEMTDTNNVKFFFNYMEFTEQGRNWFCFVFIVVLFLLLFARFFNYRLNERHGFLLAFSIHRLSCCFLLSILDFECNFWDRARTTVGNWAWGW